MAPVMPPSVTFAGQEIIPGLRPGPGNGDPAFLQLEGTCPIIISAPHAGSPGTTPAGAKAFGARASDGDEVRDDDTNTLGIAFALVRTLASLGFAPYAAINLVSRQYMDLNRQWSGQQKWVGPDGTHRPGDEAKSAAEFPRVAEFDAFRQAYYQDFHDTLRRFTTSQHPHGWLFDVHGTELDGEDTLQVVTTRGFTARRDFVYDNPANLHVYLLEGGFVLEPEVADPGRESMAINDDGTASMNLISGGRYGAHAPPADPAALPAPGPVTPGPQQHRVHGVQFELDRSIRFDQTPEALESVGMNLAHAIFRCLLGNRVLQHTGTPRRGRHAVVAYAILG